MSEIKPIPPNFQTIISDWTKDLSTTFPEYSCLWQKWSDPTISELEIRVLYDYCMTVYPERFFDILYQNPELFESDQNTCFKNTCFKNTCFLPGVEFKLLFNCPNISETTHKAMWKYLQLVLFTIVGSIHDKSKFGESANMFEGLDEDELHTKLQTAMTGMGEFFQNLSEQSANSSSDGADTGKDSSNFSQDESNFSQGMPNFSQDSSNFSQGMPNFSQDMPNVDDLHGHLKGLFGGKIGNLAKELAEEISGDMADILGKDSDNIKSTADVFKNMMKNPTKITGLIKTVSDKLQQKMNSGEISQEELMREATDILGKMKGMGGGAGGGAGGGGTDFQEMFKNMAKGMGMNIPKNAKMDMNALDRMTKQSAMKGRMQDKMAEKKEKDAFVAANKQKAMAEQIANYKPYDFSSEDKGKVKKNDQKNDQKNAVFKIEGDEKQLTSSIIRPSTLSTGGQGPTETVLITASVCDVELMYPTPTSSSNKKKKKKSKK